MSLLLHINTALDNAMVCLSDDDQVLQSDMNGEQKDHAAWLHPAVANLLDSRGLTINKLDGISVAIGPGSYTGLRVGLAAAKGYCYALKIPLIAIGTLEIMANDVKKDAKDLICPLIDARRMEVFTAVYDKNLVEKTAPLAMILHMNSFESLLKAHKILFCGNGVKKLRPILDHPHADFTESTGSANSMAELAWNCFMNRQFADIAYSEPFYLKDFHSSTPRS